MKLLFTHDTRLKEDQNGNLYTGGSYNQEVWKRYTAVFDETSFLARKETMVYELQEARERFNHFESESINFIEAPDLTNSILSFFDPKERKISNEIIEKAVLDCDYLIARIPSKISYVAIKYAEKHKKPYLVEVVACAWDSLWNHSFKGKIFAPYSFIKLKEVVKKAPYVIYVTNSFLQSRYPTKAKQVGVSDVVLEKTNKEVINKRIKKIKSFKKNEKLILGTTAAIDVKFKGQQYVIQALSRLKEEGITNFEYQIVGGGDSSFLMNIAKRNNILDQVRFMGSLPHDEVFEWLDSIDIYIQPSKQEGLPRALIEAMSRGLPALGAKTGGIPELLEEECIFENKTNVEEIVNLLKNVSKENLYYHAKRNFNKAEEYNKDMLEEKRRKFLVDFRENSNVKNK